MYPILRCTVTWFLAQNLSRCGVSESRKHQHTRQPFPWTTGSVAIFKVAVKHLQDASRGPRFLSQPSEGDEALLTSHLNARWSVCLRHLEKPGSLVYSGQGAGIKLSLYPFAYFHAGVHMFGRLNFYIRSSEPSRSISITRYFQLCQHKRKHFHNHLTWWVRRPHLSLRVSLSLICLLYHQCWG